jgi:hypothetical protein
MPHSNAIFWSVAILLGSFGGLDTPAPLAWAAWLAPCAGWHLGALGTLSASRWALPVVPGSLGTLCALGMFGLYGASEALLAFIALAGLFLVPFGLARRFGCSAAATQTACGLAVVGIVLAILPTSGGLLSSGWAKRSPASAGLVMDASPMVFVVESAGVDALRLPMFYKSDSTDFVMGTRRPWNTPLAPLALLVVGCVLVLLPSRPRLT